MKGLLVLTLGSLFISLVFNKSKTVLSMKMGAKMFMNLLPPFLTVIIIISFLLILLPGEVLEKLLGIVTLPIEKKFSGGEWRLPEKFYLPSAH